MAKRKAALVFGFLVLGLWGCSSSGPAKHIVRGRVTFQGEPMRVKPMVGKLMLYAIRADAPPPAEKFHARIADDGSFIIGGGDSRGIEAGRYKFCVEWYDEFMKSADKLAGKFDAKNSRILRTVPGEDVIIDTSQPEG